MSIDAIPAVKSGHSKTVYLFFLMVALAGLLGGCASYEGVDEGYDEPPPPVYYDGWYPDADIDVFGGDYYDGGDVYGYSDRGRWSRGGGGGGEGHYGGGWGHGGGGGGWGHGGGGGGHGGGGHGR